MRWMPLAGCALARVEAAPRLQHRDRVALLHQPQRGHAAPEPRSNDDHVEVVRHGFARSSTSGSPVNGAGTVTVLADAATRRVSRPANTGSRLVMYEA